MAIILNNLHIEYYRGITQLELEEFNHVNLFVGENNVGKSSIIEIICLLSSPLSLNIWNEIAQSRSGTKRGLMYYYGYNHFFPIDKEKKISFSGKFYDMNTTFVSMAANEFKTSIPEGEANLINGFTQKENAENNDKYIDTTAGSFCIMENNNKLEFELYDFQRRPPIRTILNEEVSGIVRQNIKTVLIESKDGLDNDYPFMRNTIIDSESYELLVEILREFDPSITGITAFEEMGRTLYYFRTSNHKSAVPISVYGDGIKKALSIFSALATHKDGIVLIDEVETSIHTSAMSKIFSVLISWARKLNIQLFVTTHSKEALDTILNCKNEYRDGVNVYTLYQKNEKNYARKLGCIEALELQNKMGMEIR